MTKDRITQDKANSLNLARDKVNQLKGKH